MKTLTFHPASALAGLLLTAVVFLAIGAGAVTKLGLVTVRATPTPAAFFRVVEGVPFVVPPERVLVISQLGLGNSTGLGPGGFALSLQFDGEDVWHWPSSTSNTYSAGMPLTRSPGIVATRERQSLWMPEELQSEPPSATSTL